MRSNPYCSSFNSLPNRTASDSPDLAEAREQLLKAFRPLIQGADCEAERKLGQLLVCVFAPIGLLGCILCMIFVGWELYVGGEAIETLKAHCLPILSADEIKQCI